MLGSTRRDVCTPRHEGNARAGRGRPGATTIRAFALGLIILGQSGYFLIWLGIRSWGSLTLTFGTWGPSWLLWFERWIEPLIILAGIAFTAFVIWREIGHGEAPPHLSEEAYPPPGP